MTSVGDGESTSIRFPLRGLFALTAIVAVVLGSILHSLRTVDVHQASNGPTLAFINHAVAREALELEFQLRIDDLTIDVRGATTNGIPFDSKTSFEVAITGHTKQSVPGFKKIWPFTQDGLAEIVRSEIDRRLGGDSGARVVSFNLPFQ